MRHWSRLREFEADRLGALVSGNRPAAAALIRTAVVAPQVYTVLENAFAYPPEEDADLVAMTAQMVDEKGWPDIRAYLQDVQSHPTDTHPPTPERIQRLDVALDTTLLETALRAPSEGPHPAGAPDRRLARLVPTPEQRLSCRSTRRPCAPPPVSGGSRSGCAAGGGDAVQQCPSSELVQFGVAAMFAAIGVAIWLFRRAIGFGDDAFTVWLILGICSAAVVICVVAGTVTRCGGRTPYLTLLPEMFSAPQLSAPIAWRDVENWGVVFGTHFGLDLILKDGVALSEARRFARGIRVHKAKRLVTIGAFGVRGMGVEDFPAVDRALHAGGPGPARSGGAVTGGAACARRSSRPAVNCLSQRLARTAISNGSRVIGKIAHLGQTYCSLLKGQLFIEALSNRRSHLSQPRISRQPKQFAEIASHF